MLTTHSQEGTTRVIKHTRFEAGTMDKMFQYLYRDDYSFDPADSMATMITKDDMAVTALSLLSIDEEGASEGLHRLASHVRVHAAAKHYELLELEHLAVAKFSLEQDFQEPLSPDDLISIAVVVYSFQSSEPSEFQQEVLRTAVKNCKEYLANSTFLRAMIERHELQEFAIRFLKEVTNHHGSELENVVQDFTSEIQKLQRELQHMTREKNATSLEGRAQESTISNLTTKNANLTTKLDDQKASHKHALHDKEEWHKHTVRGLETEKAKLQAEVTAARTRNDTLQAKQLLHNTTLASLELRRANTQTDLYAAQASINTKDQVIDQLNELNDVEECRHCGYGFIYYLERCGPNGYLARCCECRTRHFAGANNGSI